jgi:ubiquinone biosynthesis protein Coq4
MIIFIFTILNVDIDIVDEIAIGSFYFSNVFTSIYALFWNALMTKNSVNFESVI